MTTILVAYVPALHRGYWELFQKYHGAILYLIDPKLCMQFNGVRKDVRALLPTIVKPAIEGWKIFQAVEILTARKIPQLQRLASRLVLPDEDISHYIRERYFSDKEVAYESIFLRWDTQRTLAQSVVVPNTIISSEAFDQEMMGDALRLGLNSSDWWRQVGAVITHHQKVLLVGWNRHFPTDQTPYIDGDPRANFGKGLHVELATGCHIEAQLIAIAADRGIRLRGTSLYVTTFPCPTCAKVVAFSGVTKVYFAEGYSMIDAQSILQVQGIEIIKVSIPSLSQGESPRSG